MSRAGAPRLWGRLQQLLAAGAAETQDPEEPLRLAAAVLLVEMAAADHHLGEAERGRLRQLLCESFRLNSDDAADLVEQAEGATRREVSLHRHLDVLNRLMDAEQKRAVLRMLWQLAYADGSLHRNEEQLLRRLSDLLHLSHADFIRIKLEVLGEA